MCTVANLSQENVPLYKQSQENVPLYKQSQENVPLFRFPENEGSLFKKCVSFVNRTNWKLSANSVICAKHFLGKFIRDGSRKTLNWSLNPIPTLHTQIALKRPSTLKTPSAVRKPPKIRVYQDDQLQHFDKKDTIKSFSDLSEKLCPPGYSCYKTNDFIVYYNLIFGELDGFPTVCEAIQIDN